MSLSLAIYTRHDANITLSDGSRVIWYLELEKLSGERYFAFSRQPDVFWQQWERYVKPVLPSESIDILILCWVHPEQEYLIRQWFPEKTKTIKPSHHISHAASAYLFTEPKPDDLILSYDGGGDLDDVFNLYTYHPETCMFKLLHSPPLNLGTPYRMLGVLSPELALDKVFAYDSCLDLPGKIMGLAAFGELVPEWFGPIHQYFSKFYAFHTLQGASLKQGISQFLISLSKPDQYFWEQLDARNLLRTMQAVFEELVVEEVESWIEKLRPARLIVVGGCALNVLTNTRLATHFGIDVFIPPCPNDCGISLGASKLVFPQLARLPSPFSSWVVSGRYSFPSRLSYSVAGLTQDYLASRLAEGKIIGVVKGGLEIGPRALGNRSLLASPLIPGIKDRLNRIKGREFFRPVAPMVSEDAYNEYFVSGPKSPFMSFAPKALPKASFCAEALHHDGTARVQTISREQGWYSGLLQAFGNLSGHPMLLNTSFNDKGKPLLNDIDTAVTLFEQTEIDGLLVEDSFWVKDS